MRALAKRALITGITGQDGSYLAELLLAKGYEVHGLVRLGSESHDHLRQIRGRISLHAGDLLDQSSLVEVIREIEPDEIYNLAAMSHVAASWGQATLAADCTAIGALRILEGIREARPEARFFQASSSEIFPASDGVPQDESTPVSPRSPYGAAKAYAHFVTASYRNRYGLYACSGILFNHESPRRGAEFVSRKVTRAAALLKLGLAAELRLGSLEARRDWGYAPEFVDAMWRMLQGDAPEDFVIGTGRDHSVRELVDIAFDEVGLDPDEYLHSDPAAMRWGDEGFALADPSRIERRLGWTASTDFEQLVRGMVAADLEELSS
jgi:GDPmannose 4,6-dehydratase